MTKAKLLLEEKAEINKWLIVKWPEVFADGLIDKVYKEYLQNRGKVEELYEKLKQQESKIDQLTARSKAVWETLDFLRNRVIILEEKKWWRFWK